MRTSESITNIAKALAIAQGEIPSIFKSGKNPHFKSKYAKLEDAVETAKPILQKYGLSVIQIPQSTTEGKWVLTTRILHTSGEWIEGDHPIICMKNDPQGFGSALTYARRYSFMAINGLADTDDDAEEAMNRGELVKPAEQKQPSEPKKETKQKPQNPFKNDGPVPPIGQFVCTGGKYKGLEIQQVDPNELADYVGHLKKIEKPNLQTKEMINAAEQFLKEINFNLPPKFEAEEAMPF